MEVAAYIAAHGNWIDRAIAARSRGRYSHVELVFSDGEFFSSSWRDGGTRFKRIDRNSGHWDFIYRPMPYSREEELRQWCKGQLGIGYDLPGVLAFVNPFRQQNPRLWFCNEIVGSGLQEKRMISRDFIPWQLDPNEFVDIVRYNWGETR